MNEIITYGIRDSEFIRGDVPMTKEEVRVLTISKLKLKKDSILIDVGAGTGSISIEAGRILKNGTVYAVERNEEAVDLIIKNIEKFGVKNIQLIQGAAPDCLSCIKDFTHAVVGGSGGELLSILKYLAENIKRGGRIVVNAISHETLYQAYNFFRENNFTDVENILVNISRSHTKGNAVLYEALNPVNIISAEKQ